MVQFTNGIFNYLTESGERFVLVAICVILFKALGYYLQLCTDNEVWIFNAIGKVAAYGFTLCAVCIIFTYTSGKWENGNQRMEVAAENVMARMAGGSQEISSEYAAKFGKTMNYVISGNNEGLVNYLFDDLQLDNVNEAFESENKNSGRRKSKTKYDIY